MSSTATFRWKVGAAPAEVLRRCGDVEVARRRATVDPSMNARVTELATDTPDGAALVFTVAADLPAGWVPAKLVGSLPARPGLTRREEWRLRPDGCAEARIDVGLSGVPATRMTMTGTLTPVPAAVPGGPAAPGGADASSLEYAIRLDVGIPLMGRAVEGAVLEQLRRAMDQEAVVIQNACAEPGNPVSNR